MRSLAGGLLAAILLATAAFAAQAGVAAYDACLGDGYDARIAAKFAERFDGATCEGGCDPALTKTVTGLVRAECREVALDDCLSTKCRLGLDGRWAADAEDLRARIDAALARLDLDALPPLKARRLSDPASWRSATTCTGDAVICAARAKGQWLGDLERIAAELDLPL
ncbi:MAG: hypothetical protein AAFO93_15630 [Pseudomonadota bacterium]